MVIMFYSAQQIATKLAERAEQLARYLLPKGKQEGQEWVVGSINGEIGQSLKYRLSGEKRGVYCDFAEGSSGDSLDLWARSRSISISEAMQQAKPWLGIAAVDLISSSANKVFSRPSSSHFKAIQPGSIVANYLTQQRKLSHEILNIFRIGEKAEKIVFPYYVDNKLLQIKYLNVHRNNGKKEISTESNCQPMLFGWQAFPKNARTIVITEGEIDAMSLNQYGHPSLSLPFGGGTGNKHAWIEYEYERLAIFDVIYLCLDTDDVGKKTAIELIERLGRHRCRIVELPYKDANECLLQGVSFEQIKACFDAAKTCDPQELKPAQAFLSEVINQFYPIDEGQHAFYMPWQKTHDKIQLIPNELSVFCGTNGHGKSQLIGHMVLGLMQQGAKVCIASLELKPKKLLMRLTRQAAGLAQPTKGYITAIHEWYADKLWLFDLVGTAKTERVLEVFSYAYQRYGVNIFIIDSFMKCGIAEDDFNAQKKFIEQLCDFKNQFECQVYLVIHPRKASDESTPPNKLDIKGTGAISDLADNVFTVWRNKAKHMQLEKIRAQGQQPPDELFQEIDALLICDKNRNGDWEGRIGLWFEPNSYQFLNHYSQKPIQYVDYSNRVQ